MDLSGLTLDDYKRLALDAAGASDNGNAPPPTPDAPQGNTNPLPNMGPMAQQPMPNIQQQAPQVTDVQPKQGPIKSFLTQFIHGAGQGLLQHVGLQTDAEKQQVQFNQAQQVQAAQRAQQGANDLSAYRQAQTGGLQTKADLLDQQNQPFTIPNDPSVPQALRGQTTTVGNWQALSKIFSQNQGKTDVATTRADATRDAASTRADASTANAQIAAQVREDVARGNLSMAGARLRLAQAKANGELSGNTPTAQRLNKADLANNAQHNLGNVIGIIRTDPNLLGQIAGHFTTVEQMIGTGNPDITRIANEIHAAAQASGGVHGLRSAEAVKDTEKMWLNGFRNSPEATIAGLQAQSDSLNDYVNFANYGKGVAPKIQSGTPSTSPSAAPSTANPFAKYGGVVVKR